MTDSAADISPARIATRIEDRIGWLEVNNPARKNAITLTMWQAIPKAVAELAAAPGVRVIVLRGA